MATKKQTIQARFCLVPLKIIVNPNGSKIEIVKTKAENPLKF